MESFGDKLRACIYALLVHAAVALVLLAGLFWTKTTRPIQLQGPVIEAELVGLTAAPKPQARHKAKPQTAKPKAEQPPAPPEPKPTPVAPSEQHNDRLDREKVAELAQQAEKAKRAQEERQRQEQVLLKQQQQERERQKQLAEVKRQQEALDRKLKLEQDKLAQLRDLAKQKTQAPPQPENIPPADKPTTGMNGTDSGLQARYLAAIQSAVTDSWLRPDSAAPGLRCMLRIVQIPGGDVISVNVENPCNADPQTRNSIEQAVKRAEPLPYKGYEKVFQREINFNFTYDG